MAGQACGTHVLVLEMLEQFEFSICALGEHRRAERLHDLFDGHGLSSELVFRRAGGVR
jgi:hypothetical protein